MDLLPAEAIHCLSFLGATTPPAAMGCFEILDLKADQPLTESDAGEVVRSCAGPKMPHIQHSTEYVARQV